MRKFGPLDGSNSFFNVMFVIERFCLIVYMEFYVVAGADEFYGNIGA